MTIKVNIYVLGLFLLMSHLCVAQDATLFGVVKSDKGIPIEGLSIEYKRTGSISDEDGHYSLDLPAGKELTIVFSHLSYQNQIHTIKLNSNEQRSFNITLVSEVTVIVSIS